LNFRLFLPQKKSPSKVNSHENEKRLFRGSAIFVGAGCYIFLTLPPYSLPAIFPPRIRCPFSPPFAHVLHKVFKPAVSAFPNNRMISHALFRAVFLGTNVVIL